FSDAAGADATVVKLARVALLAPVVALVSLAFPRDGAAAGQPIWRRLALPWFIVAFLALVAINSLTPVPAIAADYGLIASKALLLLAVIATAMRSRMDLLIEIGWRALGPVFGATMASLIAAISFAFLLF
ncbi:MAG: putative sulfate exporter family transporter, partial [Sphingomonas sp.]